MKSLGPSDLRAKTKDWVKGYGYDRRFDAGDADLRELVGPEHILSSKRTQNALNPKLSKRTPLAPCHLPGLPGQRHRSDDSARIRDMALAGKSVQIS